MLWSCIKPFLDEILIEKIKISNGSSSSEMLSSFNPHQLEEKYGGRLKNLEKFWPPTVPNSPFDAPGMTISLSSKDSYFSFHHEAHPKEESPASIKKPSKQRTESQDLSLDHGQISIEELESEKCNRSDFEEPDEPLVELEKSVFFDCKPLEKSFKSEEKLKKILLEKSFHNKDNLSPCKAVDFETPKKKGPRPIGIILENEDRFKRCSKFGCCESENYSCSVF
jgi:hypothetical protein